MAEEGRRESSLTAFVLNIAENNSDHDIVSKYWFDSVKRRTFSDEENLISLTVSLVRIIGHKRGIKTIKLCLASCEIVSPLMQILML